MTEDIRPHALRHSHEDAAAARAVPDTPQTRAPAYRLAFTDREFLLREELRPVRLQLELLKPEMILDERGIVSTVVMFGGARIPDPAHKGRAATRALGDLARFYEEARVFSRRMTERSLAARGCEWVVCTGGGPGVMEAGNRGADDVGGQSIGLNIVLPHEQAPNAYVTPDLCFNFHYFAIRKMHFLMRARAIAVFPGGFGTMDEMFEALTLIQTGRMAKVPFVLFGKEWWGKVIDWQMLASAGVISSDDIDLFRLVDTAAEAIEAIDTWQGAGEIRGAIPGR